MAPETNRKAGELLQIVILAGFFTAGGFLLVTLGLVLKVNPDLEAEGKAKAEEYEKLKKLQADSQMKILRQQAKKSEGQEGAKDLKAIVTDTMASFGLDYQSLPAAVTKPKSGLTELTQKVTLKPAGMRSILQFVATVKEAKKSIEVASLDLTPNRRGDSKDSWNATVEFVDYIAQ